MVCCAVVPLELLAPIVAGSRPRLFQVAFQWQGLIVLVVMNQDGAAK